MKAGRFEYVRPASLDEALRLIADARGEAAVIAGGQSLLPILGLRLTGVGCLIDIGRLRELAECGSTARYVTVGAAVTHAAIEDGLTPDPGRGLMRRVAARIAYRPVRNQGTIGGSIALADPAADWPACLIALRATAIVAARGGSRREPVADLVRGTYITSLASDELIVGFEIPRLTERARVGVSKVAKKSGAFAMSSAFAVIDEAQAGGARVALAGAGARALPLAHVGALLSERVDAPAEALGDAVAADLAGVVDAGDEYGARLHRATVLKAIEEARAR